VVIFALLDPDPIWIRIHNIAEGICDNCYSVLGPLLPWLFSLGGLAAKNALSSVSTPLVILTRTKYRTDLLDPSYTCICAVPYLIHTLNIFGGRQRGNIEEHLHLCRLNYRTPRDFWTVLYFLNIFFVPDDMIVPGLCCHFKVGPSIAVFQLRVGLQPNKTKFETSTALSKKLYNYIRTGILGGQV
jgi:hypothetical protein